MGTMYGYVRVSSTDQNENRQLDAMHKRGIEDKCIYVDKQSGKDFKRPYYQALVRKLSPGDVLCITSIDRLGRNYEEIQEQWRLIIKKKKADIQVFDMPLLDTRREKNLLGTFIADLVLQLLSFFSHNERENIRKRQAEGIAAAKARGVHFGRKPRPLPEKFPEALKLWAKGELSDRKAAFFCGMPCTTFRYWATRSGSRGLP